MNKNHYKVIFSRVLNRFIVVSELAKTQGKATGENLESVETKTMLNSTALLASPVAGLLKPVHFSLMVALGFVYLAPNSAQADVDMAIRADKSAPGHQQPTVLQTANGLPQVNIQTPSAGGVSRNQYSQFDVAEKGAVLNNARKATQSQMAGWVQGNPNLARGEAKVILNEVNSANPSRLKGYVEVAGKKADVVIANPSGIHCEGCGVINAGRTTMTTGNARLENGELKGFDVNRGKVTVAGKGMDNSQSDYTDIIAEKVKIDGGVWSKKGIKVTTGKKRVNRTNDSVVYVGDKNRGETDRTSEPQAHRQDDQSYAVDVSQLGGMYAERIHLVDHGNGLGVRNAGHIGASAGNVQIDSQGRIVNSGFIGANENTAIQSIKDIENHGTIYAKGSTQLNAKNIDNKQGVIAGQRVDVRTTKLDNQKQTDTGSIIVATDKVSINAKHIDNQGTKTVGKTEQGIRGRQVDITAENLSNQQGGIYADEQINLNIAKMVDNKTGEIEAIKSIQLKAKTLANEGNIKTKGDLTVQLQDSLELNNAFQVGGILDFKTQGDLKNKSQLRVGNKASIQAANIENAKDAEMSGRETSIMTNTLTNRGIIDGVLTIAKAVTINNLGTGRIYGEHIALQGDRLNNLEEEGKSAVIAARESLDIGVDKVLNRNESTLLSMGKIYVGKALDDSHQVIGKSAYVHNYNGLIEALNLYDTAKTNAMSFNTDSVENKHFFLKTENVDTSSTPIFEYRIGKDSTIYDKTAGVYKVKQDNKSSFGGLNKKVKNLYHIHSPDGKIESDNWHEYNYIRTINETVVLDPEYQEGKIFSGGGINFNDASVDNQDSKIIAGGIIEVSEGQLNQSEFKGRTIVTDKGLVTAFYKGRACARQVLGKCIDHYDTTKSNTTSHFKQSKSVKDLGVLAYKENVSPEFTNHDVANKADVGEVVLNRLTQLLDKSSLYQVNPESSNGYVIETDSRFANKQKWLSSDYLFNALRYEPNNMLKRLGDGFYELRLVNEQINQLTGRRYLAGYQNDLEQYKDLMDNGVRYAKKFNLVPGVGLTEKQMAELTSDLVWMVNQEITLPSGKKLNVLTPKIYLASNRAQVSPTGAVISGDSIVGRITNMSNEGTMLAANLVNLYSQNLENKGLVLANNVNLNAEQRLVNLGGKIVAAESISLYGGKSVDLNATTTENQSRLGRTETGSKLVERQSELTVTGKAGAVSIQSSGDIIVKAAKVKSEGSVDVNAKGKLSVTTEKQHNKTHYDFSADHHYHLYQENEVSSVIESKTGLRLVGQQKVAFRQAEVESADGQVSIASQGDVLIEEGRHRERLDTRNKQTSKGMLTNVTEENRHKHDNELSQGSVISGKDVVVYSQAGDASVQGSNVIAENGLTIQAKNIDIKEAENRVYSEDFYSKKKSGLLSGGVGITLGRQKQTAESDQTKYYAAGSQVGSLNGDSTLIAEKHYTQTASSLSSVKGEVNILARQVNIQSADDKYETHTKQTFEQKGLTVAITSPILSALQAVQSAVKSGEKVGKSKNDRVNAMSAANVAMDAYRAGQAVGQAGKAVQDALGEGGVDSVVGVQITYGQQKSVNQTHTAGKTAATAQVNAGGKVKIVATGAGKASDIHINGADVSGKGGTHLIADNDINLSPAEQHHKERSTHQSRGVNVGAAIKVSNGAAAGVTLGGQYGKGYGNGDEKTYVASHVGDANSQTTFNAGGDVNIINSQVKGNRVSLNTENLNIASLQDTATYTGKQINVAGSVTVGAGVAASGSFNQSKTSLDYASVNEQAGIYAGDNGYDVNVKNKVSLTGGAILSQAPKEKNQLTAQDFEYSNIQNYSNAKSSAMGLMGGVSFGRDQTSDEDKELNDVYRKGREGETFEQANPNKANESAVKFGLGTDDIHSTDFYAAAKIGLANLAGNSKQSENRQSTTYSVISEGNFNIGSDKGKENMESIKKSTEQESNKLEKVDYSKMQKNVEQDVETIQGFAKNVAGFTDEAYRSQFIAEHRMMGYVTDKDGKPIKDKKILDEMEGEAKMQAKKEGISEDKLEKYITDYISLEVSKGKNIYQLYEVSDQQRNRLRKTGYIDPETEKYTEKVVVGFNGIFNQLQNAAKYATQNYVTDENNNRIYKNLYFIHNPEANGLLPELLVAGYQKYFEGNIGGLGNSTIQGKNLMEKYGKQGLFIGSHSRGTLTVTNALNNLEQNVDLSGTTMKMLGPATNVKNADRVFNKLSGSHILLDNDGNDGVGILIGWNPSTQTVNNQNYPLWKLAYDIFKSDASPHNCGGLGNKFCQDQGYRNPIYQNEYRLDNKLEMRKVIPINKFNDNE